MFVSSVGVYSYPFFFLQIPEHALKVHGKKIDNADIKIVHTEGAIAPPDGKIMQDILGYDVEDEEGHRNVSHYDGVESKEEPEAAPVPADARSNHSNNEDGGDDDRAMSVTSEHHLPLDEHHQQQQQLPPLQSISHEQQQPQHHHIYNMHHHGGEEGMQHH